MTNEELYEITGSTSLSSLLKFYLLRWGDHLNRIPNHRMPRLYGVLEKGSRSVSKSRLRYKNVLNKI